MRVGESPKLKLEVTCAVSHAKDYGRFPLSPGVWVRNQMKGTICLVCPEYSGPSLNLVHFIRFYWSDRNHPHPNPHPHTPPPPPTTYLLLYALQSNY